MAIGGGGANNVGTIIVIEVASNWGLELLQISTDWKPLSQKYVLSVSHYLCFYFLSKKIRQNYIVSNILLYVPTQLKANSLKRCVVYVVLVD